MRTLGQALYGLGALLVMSGVLASQAPAEPTSSPAAAAALAASSAAPETPPQPLWSPEEHAAIELLRGLRRKDRPADAELVASLTSAGERVVPLFFEVLVARVVPVADLASKGTPQVLSEVQENIVLAALAQLERDAVLAHATAALAASATVPRRAAALACIGAAGRANDLPQLFELALATDETALDEHLERAFRRAVTTLVRHDPRAVEQLVSLRRITRAELLPALVAAVGAARDPRALTYLSEVAYWHDALVQDVMSQVPLLGPSGDEAIDAAMKVRLRPYLDEAKPGPCRAAIVALSALADDDSIAALIALLDSESEGLRENAHWALKQLTGLSLAPSSPAWSRWHQGELFWMLRAKPREFQRLKENEPAVVADALREILVHPLARAELTSALPDLLKNRFPAIRVLACRTLSDLSARDAVGKLVWTLEDPEPEVARAAHAALRKLTRLDLPCEPVAWQSATNTEPKGTEL